MNIIDDPHPWGSERWFTQNEPTTVKLLFVKAGQELSLQYHEHRDEFSRVISGTPTILVGDEATVAKPGDEFFAPRGIKHRVTAGDTDVTILEISFGDFDETDIIRLEDKYGRT